MTRRSILAFLAFLAFFCVCVGMYSVVSVVSVDTVSARPDDARRHDAGRGVGSSVRTMQSGVFFLFFIFYFF